MGVRLPSEYQEVEYITSALGQWIDTGYVIQNEKIQIEAKFVTCSTSSERDLIGNQDQTSNRFVFGIYAWYFFAYARGSTSESNLITRTYSSTRRMFNSTVLYDLENSIKSITINEESWSAGHTVNIVSGTDTTVKVFSDGRNQGLFVCDLYSIKLIDGDNLAFDLVPCYRKADSKPGMYDLVTNQFFTNAGTGEFTVGLDVLDSISPWLVARRRALMARKPLDCPYVKDGLIFWLDGIRKGDDPTVWKDLVRGIAFDMSGVTFTTNGVEFAAGSYGAYDGNIAVAWDVGTIEACVDYASYQTAILSQKSYSPTPLSLINGTVANVGYAADGQARPRGNAAYGWKTLSVNADLVVRNGTSVGFGTNDSWTVNPDRYTYLGIRRSDLSSYRFTGTMYAIRIYDRKLTEQEMIFNQSVDNSRFNLGLNI